MAAPQIRTRDDLLFALTLAAELEHSLSCQYLFAAYSLKKSPEEGLTWPQAALVQEWATVLTEIARQEMEHLGLVNNLLTAIGGAPHFQRPNFPQPSGAYGIPLRASLSPLDPVVLERFIEYERPEEPATHPDGVPVDVEFASIHGLYRLIEEAFARLDEHRLFIGPPSAQVDNEVMHQERVGETRNYGVKLIRVHDRASALQAVAQIIEEGEGATRSPDVITPPDGHFERLQAMHSQYRQALNDDPDFAPSRAVVPNPVTRTRHRGADAGTLLTHPSSKAVAALFDTAYETLLIALARFYTRTTETDSEMYGLQRTAFFPLMVMVLRPLAEVLTQMPAFSDDRQERAGPPFEFYRSVGYLPQKEAAWTVIHEHLTAMAREARVLCEAPGVPGRMGFIAENLDRIAVNFADFMALPHAVLRPR